VFPDSFASGYISLLDRRLWNYTSDIEVRPNAGDLGFPIRCVQE
jgi:hypothetical protein